MLDQENKRRKSSMKFSFIVALILTLLVPYRGASSFALGEKPKLETPSAVQTVALDFTLKDLEGHNVKLSDYRGKVVFLNFWATWCPPCRAEMPSMQKLYEKLKGKDFEMLAISVDRQGKSVVEPFIEKNSYTFRVLLDSDGKIASQYGIVSIPTTFIIGKDGKIVSKIIGAKDWSEESIVKWIRSLL